MKRAIMMDAADDVVTMLSAAEAGDFVEIFNTDNKRIGEAEALQRIPYGCKMALKDIEAGETIKKYGAVIGEATKNVKSGELVHMHNLKSRKVDMPYSAKIEIMRQLGYDMEGCSLKPEVSCE